MPKPNYIELGPRGALEEIPIVYEDRSVLAIDKPRGWMLVPFNWQKTSRNLQAALESSIRAGDFWARSRNLRFLRHIHRLDAETTGILLLARSPGALESYGRLFESRQMHKRYLVVVKGVPDSPEWICRLKLAPNPDQFGKMQIDPHTGKNAETHFRTLQVKRGRTLLEARPITGRTHQIRLHLAAAKLPVAGDDLYGSPHASAGALALRAVELAYRDPFTRRDVEIRVDSADFLRSFGFKLPAVEQKIATPEGRKQ